MNANAYSEDPMLQEGTAAVLPLMASARAAPCPHHVRRSLRWWSVPSILISNRRTVGFQSVRN